MASTLRLLIGLGNPGEEYARTRHNVGFAVADAVAEHRTLTFASEQAGAGRWLRATAGAEGSCDVAFGRWRGRPFGLVKPMTYMNRSGSAVAKMIRKHGLRPGDVLVIYDDINLPLGAVRLRASGGAGGHNGLQDIIDEVNSENLPRMRVGIGDNFGRGQQVRYVLSPFSEAEQPIVEETIRHARDAALAFVSDGLVPAMNRYNRKASPLSPPPVQEPDP